MINDQPDNPLHFVEFLGTLRCAARQGREGHRTPPEGNDSVPDGGYPVVLATLYVFKESWLRFPVFFLLVIYLTCT